MGDTRNMNTTTNTTFEVWGVTRGGGWEYQGAWQDLADAERIKRILAPGQPGNYAEVVIRKESRD